MQETRQRILNFLDTNYQASALEISQAFKMTPANIRHHLNLLEKDNKVEVIGRSEAEGRGRPNLIYMPTAQSSDHGLVNLSTALLGVITDHRSKKQKDNQLKKLGSKLIGEVAESNKSISLKLGAAVQTLNDLGYNSHWEAHSESPQIFLGHCPYAEIADQHPELCEMDAFMIEKMVNKEVRQIEKCSRKPGESNHCVFKIMR